MKSGTYDEVLPIHIPNYVTVLGDNIRNTVISAKSGNSNEQDLALASALTSYRLGDVVSNSAGDKTAKVLDINAAKTSVTILNVSGGAWTNSDKYVDITDNKHADGGNLAITNKAFLAKEAWYAYAVANGGNPSGVQATVESRLSDFVQALGENTVSYTHLTLPTTPYV